MQTATRLATGHSGGGGGGDGGGGDTATVGDGGIDGDAAGLLNVERLLAVAERSGVGGVDGDAPARCAFVEGAVGAFCWPGLLLRLFTLTKAESRARRSSESLIPSALSDATNAVLPAVPMSWRMLCGVEPRSLAARWVSHAPKFGQCDVGRGGSKA